MTKSRAAAHKKALDFITLSRQCPVCKRHKVGLEDHIKSKHKGYVPNMTYQP